MVGLREFGLCLAETRLRLTAPLLGGIVLSVPTQETVVGRRACVFIARIFAQGGESLSGRCLGLECRGKFTQAGGDVVEARPARGLARGVTDIPRAWFRPGAPHTTHAKLPARRYPGFGIDRFVFGAGHRAQQSG